MSLPLASSPTPVAEGAGPAAAVARTFEAVAALRPRVQDALDAQPHLFAPADAAIRAGAEFSARRNRWGGRRPLDGRAAGRVGRLGRGIHLEAFPGLPPDLQGRASVQCLRTIFNAAPEEVKALLRRPVINADDPCIVGYMARLRSGVRAYEELLKAHGMDDAVSRSRIDNSFGWLKAAGVSEPMANTLAFAAAGVSPQIGARTLFAGAAASGGGGAAPPPARCEEASSGPGAGCAGVRSGGEPVS